MEAKRVHLVALPVPLQGHINPMLNWLRRLGAAAGVVSTLLVPESHVARLNLQEPLVRAVGIPSSVIDVIESKLVTSVPQMVTILEALEEAKDGLAEFISTLSCSSGSSSSSKWDAPISCLVVDVFIHMGQDLANDLGIPRVGFWSSSAAALAVSTLLPRLFAEGILPSKEMDELAIDCIPGITGLRRKNLPQSILTDADLSWRFKIMARSREARCVVGNTIYELESQVIDAIESVLGTNFVPIGPLFDVDKELIASSPSGGAASLLWEEDVHCLGWLDKQAAASVLYVSFGSMAQLSAVQVEQLALGLEASRQAFLWVLRPNLVQGLQQRFLEDFSERTADRGLVIAWAPQLKVLGHSSVGGFLTHCGWNSTMEAVCCGVPMLGWACFAEQNLNCKFIVDDWEIGLRFSRGADGLVAAGEIERAIRLLMVDEEPGAGMRSRCRALAARVTRAAAELKFDPRTFV